MCLGIPGKVVRVFDEAGLRMGEIDFGGTARVVCMAYLSDAAPGDYAVIHAGFAISKLDEDEARRALALVAELAEISDDGAIK
jgi:hydrogenase expression/formation protein HypC